MDDIGGEPTIPSAESAAFRATLKADHQSTALPADTMAADTQASREVTKNNTRISVDSPFASAAEGEAALPPPARLIDSDPSKFRSLKRVIVIGRPGSGTDGECGAFRDPS